MGNQTNARREIVKPSAVETGSGVSPDADQVRTSGYEIVEVWLEVTAFSSGSITEVVYEGAPVERPGNGSVATALFGDTKVFGGPLAIASTGMFFIGTVSRKNSEGVGLAGRVSWTMTGNITFSVTLIGKE